MPMSQRSVDVPKSAIRFGGKSYAFGDGFKSATKGFTGKANLVYVGNGFLIKKQGIDPYAGLDLRGKIMVVASGFPKGASYGDLNSGAQGVDYMWPMMAAQKFGAVAIIRIPTPGELSDWNADQGAKMGGIERDFGPDANNGLPEIVASPELARAILSGEAISADDAAKGPEAPNKGFALNAAKTIDVEIGEKRERFSPKNVVALIPGSDPKLRHEIVAFGAHIDHVGMRPGGNGDRIFNGADDDGSGTVSILEIAHAFLTGPRPKRSCLFVWHVGEEYGMYGSEHFTRNPTVDLKNVVTQLNIDMIGRSKPAGDTKRANRNLTGPNEIYVIGSRMMSSDLHRTSESVNSKFLGLTFNYKYDDVKEPEQFFFRSDHYMYARKGIPILFYFDGEHEDYHGVGDEVSKIDFDKMAKVARTVYATGWTLANAPKLLLADEPTGQIGGMSPFSTAEYYLDIVRMHEAAFGDCSYPRILVASVSFQSVIDLQHAGRWDDLATLIQGEYDSLMKAGADLVGITTNTMHRVLPSLCGPVPILPVYDGIAARARETGAQTLGLVGTRFTMNDASYRAALAARGVELLVPPEEEQAEVQRLIYEELVKGRPPANPAAFWQTAQALLDCGADAILLGCTELRLVHGGHALPKIDSTHEHARLLWQSALTTASTLP